MIKLIKNVEVYSPEKIGKSDVLIADMRIAAISPEIHMAESEYVEIIDGTGKLLVPGFIDAHVHILGGGGEGGYRTRTPELQLSDLIKGGISTVVGCLGTDGIARNMESLVAKAYGLREEGVTAFVYTGSYRVPVKTLTESIQKDIMMIEPVIGVGEVAVSDHRSSVPTREELARVIADARVGGILSGKSGVVNIHLGDGKTGLNPIEEVLSSSDIPYTQVLPTHANRNPDLYVEALKYAKNGGYVDFTTSTVPAFIEEGEVKASKAFAMALEQGVSSDHMTFSSDGQGSLPRFDKLGKLEGLDVGKVTSLFESVVELVREFNISLEVALKPITENPARLLKLKGKGTIAVGCDADLVLLDSESLQITDVFYRGKQMMKATRLVECGTFERCDS